MVVIRYTKILSVNKTVADSITVEEDTTDKELLY